jgi:hypothetical protein
MVHPIISLEITMSADENKKLMQEIFAGLAVGDRSLFQRSVTGNYRIVVMGRSSWSQTVEGEALCKYQEYVRARFSAPGKTVPERFIAAVPGWGGITQMLRRWQRRSTSAIAASRVFDVIAGAFQTAALI